MGHDVYYHEDTWSWPFNPVKNTADEEGHYAARFLADFFDRFAPDLKERWHYLHLHDQSFGMSRSKFDEVSRTADLFLNISGANFIPDLLPASCVKVFIDTDPGYNQIMLIERFDWSEFVDRWCAQFYAHDSYFTFAEAIAEKSCLVPAVNVEWHPTRMPIVLDYWKAGLGRPPDQHWSSIMTWNVFKGRLEHGGVEYGDKAVEFEKMIELPARVGPSITLAVGGTEAPVDRLEFNGWDVVPAPDVTRSPAAYQDFIMKSRGEVSVVKNVYSALRTGWFSERSACYLASRRPVVLQDTGFSDVFPVGTGLLAFTDLEEAVEAVLAVELDYERHAQTALDIAHSFFDHESVLRSLLNRVGA